MSTLDDIIAKLAPLPQAERDAVCEYRNHTLKYKPSFGGLYGQKTRGFVGQEVRTLDGDRIPWTRTSFFNLDVSLRLREHSQGAGIGPKVWRNTVMWLLPRGSHGKTYADSWRARRGQEKQNIARVQGLGLDQATLLQPEQQGLEVVRRQRHCGMRSLAQQLREFSRGYGAKTGRHEHRAKQWETRIHAWQLRLGNDAATGSQQIEQSNSSIQWRGYDAGGGLRSGRDTIQNSQIKIAKRLVRA